MSARNLAEERTGALLRLSCEEASPATWSLGRVCNSPVALPAPRQEDEPPAAIAQVTSPSSHQGPAPTPAESLASEVSQRVAAVLEQALAKFGERIESTLREGCERTEARIRTYERLVRERLKSEEASDSKEKKVHQDSDIAALQARTVENIVEAALAPLKDSVERLAGQESARPRYTANSVWRQASVFSAFSHPSESERDQRRPPSRSNTRQTLGSQIGRNKETVNHGEVRLGNPALRHTESDVNFLALAEGTHRDTVLDLVPTELRKAKKSVAKVVPESWFNYIVDKLRDFMTLEEPPHTGELARLVGSRVFECLCMAVILTNAGVLIYRTNAKMESPGQDTESQLAVSIDTGFLCFYILEILLRMFVHRLFFFVGSDMLWNAFDLCLVVISTYDNLFAFILAGDSGSKANATVLRSLRVLKVAKVLRMLRLMRGISHLRILLESVIGSLVHLFFAVVLLGFILGLFALLFVQSVANFVGDQGSNVDLDTLEKLRNSYGSVEVAMLSLFESISGGRLWHVHFEALIPTGPGNCLFFLCFIGLMQISVINILTAMIVENTLKVAEPDMHNRARELRRQERSATAELKQLCIQMDVDNSGTVTADELDCLLTNPQFRSYLTVLGLDVRNTAEFFDLLGFIGGVNEVDIDAFVQGCMCMRGHASGIAQQNLLAEAKFMRRGQQELYFQVMDRLGDLSKTVNEIASAVEQGGSRENTSLA